DRLIAAPGRSAHSLRVQQTLRSELEGEEEPVLVPAGVVQLQDVRMLEGGGDARFMLEGGAAELGHGGGARDLQGHLAILDLVERLPHLGERSAAQSRDQEILSDPT